MKLNLIKVVGIVLTMAIIGCATFQKQSADPVTTVSSNPVAIAEPTATTDTTTVATTPVCVRNCRSVNVTRVTNHIVQVTEAAPASKVDAVVENKSAQEQKSHGLSWWIAMIIISIIALWLGRYISNR